MSCGIDQLRDSTLMSLQGSFLFFFFYCYAITVVCLFSPSLYPTPGEPTSLPPLHPPPWFSKANIQALSSQTGEQRTFLRESEPSLRKDPQMLTAGELEPNPAQISHWLSEFMEPPLLLLLERLKKLLYCFLNFIFQLLFAFNIILCQFQVYSIVVR